MTAIPASRADLREIAENVVESFRRSPEAEAGRFLIFTTTWFLRVVHCR